MVWFLPAHAHVLVFPVCHPHSGPCWYEGRVGMGSLRDLAEGIKSEQGTSIALCEFWSDTLDRWAEDLVDPACSGACPAGYWCSAGYMFAYSIFYFYTKLEITKPVSAVIYFCNMWVGALMFFLLTGTIGFFACYWVVLKIFPQEIQSMQDRRRSNLYQKVYCIQAKSTA